MGNGDLEPLKHDLLLERDKIKQDLSCRVEPESEIPEEPGSLSVTAVVRDELQWFCVPRRACWAFPEHCLGAALMGWMSISGSHLSSHLRGIRVSCTTTAPGCGPEDSEVEVMS